MTSIRRLCVSSTAATFVLVAIGGLVRATKSGLGCGTDWPDCGGRLVPSMETRAEMIEFSHRLAASIVVILLGVLLVFAFRQRKLRPRLFTLAAAAFGLVLWQAVLGAIVVKLELEAESVVLHLGTALALMALLVYMTVGVFATDGNRPEQASAHLTRRALWAAGSVFALLLVGSWVTGSNAGYAFSDWPLMDGKVIPDLSNDSSAIHFAHRALAGIVGVVVLGVGLGIARRKSEYPVAAKLAHAAMGLYLLEVLVGALNVWTELNSAAVTIHLATGALIWTTLVGLASVTHPAIESVAAEHPIPARQAAYGEGV